MVKKKIKTSNKKAKSSVKKEEYEQKIAELTDLLQRNQASFENFRKQTEKRIEEIYSSSSKNILLKVLPILDNFELALKNTANHQDFVQGTELIYSQLNKMLGDEGIKVIETKNKIFDPHLHEALMKVDSDKDENVILEEFQKGFTLNNKVIRHARVKLSSGKKSVENK